MALCVALLRGPLDHKQMANWFTTDSFMGHILHVEKLKNVSPASGTLTADPFVIPQRINPKDIEGLAIFDSQTKVVELRYGFQVPALGISCVVKNNVICLRGWCDEPLTVHEYESDCAILNDPCALYKELRCCYLKLVKDQEKVAITFRDRSVRFQPRTEQDKTRLLEMMLEAKSKCECDDGMTNWRGGYLGRHCDSGNYR